MKASSAIRRLRHIRRQVIIRMDQVAEHSAMAPVEKSVAMKSLRRDLDALDVAISEMTIALSVSAPRAEAA